MPLILAIEPDKRQAAQLKVLVRTRLGGADLVLADTTELALEAIGNRVPDLILVPALLSAEEDGALAAALRVIAAAAHVQTLTIPVFAPPNSRGGTKVGGMLAKLLKGRSDHSSEGCDPGVFADQIAAYLAEAAAEREAREYAESQIADEPETEEPTAPRQSAFDPVETFSPVQQAVDAFDALTASHEPAESPDQHYENIPTETYAPIESEQIVDEPGPVETYAPIVLEPTLLFRPIEDEPAPDPASVLDVPESEPLAASAPAAEEAVADPGEVVLDDLISQLGVEPAAAEPDIIELGTIDLTSEPFDASLFASAPHETPAAEPAPTDSNVFDISIGHEEPESTTVADPFDWAPPADQSIAVDLPPLTHDEVARSTFDEPARAAAPVAPPEQPPVSEEFREFVESFDEPFEEPPAPVTPEWTQLPVASLQSWPQMQGSAVEQPVADLIAEFTADLAHAPAGSADAPAAGIPEAPPPPPKKPAPIAPPPPRVPQTPLAAASSLVAQELAKARTQKEAPVAAKPTVAPKPSIAPRPPAAPVVPAAQQPPAGEPMAAKPSAERITPAASVVSRPAARHPRAKPEWTELIESLRKDMERMRAERGQPSKPLTSVAMPVAASTAPPPPAPPKRPPATPPPAARQAAAPAVVAHKPGNGADTAQNAPPKRHQDKAGPVQDEWGFFDPQQCGFAALLAKLDEITDSEDKRSA